MATNRGHRLGASVDQLGGERPGAFGPGFGLLPGTEYRRAAVSARCSRCGVEAGVCCNTAYVVLDDGTQEHVDPICRACCGPHPRLITGVGGFERMDCDH